MIHCSKTKYPEARAPTGTVHLKVNGKPYRIRIFFAKNGTSETFQTKYERLTRKNIKKAFDHRNCDVPVTVEFQRLQKNIPKSP